jgi:hypothetical protein
MQYVRIGSAFVIVFSRVQYVEALLNTCFGRSGVQNTEFFACQPDTTESTCCLAGDIVRIIGLFEFFVPIFWVTLSSSHVPQYILKEPLSLFSSPTFYEATADSPIFQCYTNGLCAPGPTENGTILTPFFVHGCTNPSFTAPACVPNCYSSTFFLSVHEPGEY